MGNFLKGGSSLHQIIVNSGKRRDTPRNRLPGINERLPKLNQLRSVVYGNGNFRNPIALRVAPGSLDINDGKFHKAKIQSWFLRKS